MRLPPRTATRRVLGVMAPWFPPGYILDSGMRGHVTKCGLRVTTSCMEVMSDRYQDFASSQIGKFLVKASGCPVPPRLTRYDAGAPLVDGTVLLGGDGRLAGSLLGLLDGWASTTPTRRLPSGSFKGLVFDAPASPRPTSSSALREFFTPLLRRLEHLPAGGRARHPARAGRGCGAGRPARTGGLHPQPRQGDRPGRHGPGSSTSPSGAEGCGRLHARLPALAEVGVRLRARWCASAPTARQARRRWTTGSPRWPARSPWSPARAVASASRSPGCCTATARRSSASTCPRRPASCRRVMRELDGDYLILDITARGRAAADRPPPAQSSTAASTSSCTTPASPATRSSPTWPEDRWDSASSPSTSPPPERITRELLDQGVINDGGSIIGVASIAGIAGNVGQTNYAASKAGVIGLVDSPAPTSSRRASPSTPSRPGFIITQMTAAGARSRPARSASASTRWPRAACRSTSPRPVAWYALPGSTAVNGNVVRVCGQMMLGA